MYLCLSVPWWELWSKAAFRPQQWAEHEQYESALTTRGAVHNVLNTSPHRSAQSCSPLSTDFTLFHSEITLLTRGKRKNLCHILQAAVGCITPPSRLLSSYSLINPTFVFAHSSSQATPTWAGLDMMWAALERSWAVLLQFPSRLFKNPLTDPPKVFCSCSPFAPAPLTCSAADKSVCRQHRLPAWVELKWTSFLFYNFPCNHLVSSWIFGANWA